MPQTHHLKTHSDPFWAVYDRKKTFEVRKNDRGYEVDDTLVLKEFDPAAQTFSGWECIRRVTYILPGGKYGIPEDYVVMALADITSARENLNDEE